VFVCPHNKTITAETTITKLAARIVHHESSPTEVERSKVKLKVIGLVSGVTGVSYVL